MLVALPSEELAGQLFKTIFLHHLPGDLKDLVAVQFQQLAALELVKFADVIWDARNTKKTVVASVRPPTKEEKTTQGELTALGKAVAALTIHNKKKWHGNKSRGGGHPREARFAAEEAVRARSHCVRSTTAPVPIHAPRGKTSKLGRGSG